MKYKIVVSNSYTEETKRIVKRMVNLYKEAGMLNVLDDRTEDGCVLMEVEILREELKEVIPFWGAVDMCYVEEV